MPTSNTGGDLPTPEEIGAVPNPPNDGSRRVFVGSVPTVEESPTATSIGAVPVPVDDGLRKVIIGSVVTPESAPTISSLGGLAKPPADGNRKVIIGDTITSEPITNVLTSASTTSPLSAAQGKVLQDTKQVNLVSGVNIKTINGESILSAGDLVVPQQYQRYWFIRKQSTETFTVNSTATDITARILAGVPQSTEYSPPIIFDTANGVIKVDPSTTYSYPFSIQFRFIMRISGAQTRRLYIQIRRPNGTTIVDSFPFDFGSDIATNTPFFLSSVLQTRIFSGGTDLYQTQGFKVFLVSDPIDNFSFNPADTNNFQVNFERA